MANPYYEIIKQVNEFGIRLVYRTVHGGYRPLHWHKELEILFPLNGDADITIEGQKHKLLNRQILVIDSEQIHSTYSYTQTHMFACIQISKQALQKYIPDIELRKIRCIPEEITDEQFPHYIELCKMAADLTRLYIEDTPASHLESEGIILQMLARLIRHFSTSYVMDLSSQNIQDSERIKEIISFVDKHYMEPLSLQDAADLVGFSKEYFCRFFKKHMNLSFLQYLNEVRITHIYQELNNTDTPISILQEEHGFTNQKLFNKTFKEMYGTTPSAIRNKKERE